MTFTTFVRGTPATQGSKRHVGGGVMVESSKRTKPWRTDVREAVMAAHDGPPWDGPLEVMLTFVFARPKSHYWTGKNAHLLKDDAPRYPAGRRNDLDKLARAILDACTSAGLWGDDGQVVDLSLLKVYEGGMFRRGPGCEIEVRQLVPLTDAEVRF